MQEGPEELPWTLRFPRYPCHTQVTEAGRNPVAHLCPLAVPPIARIVLHAVPTQCHGLSPALLLALTLAPNRSSSATPSAQPSNAALCRGLGYKGKKGSKGNKAWGCAREGKDTAGRGLDQSRGGRWQGRVRVRSHDVTLRHVT